jgi:putative oxidoreductase
VGPVVLRLAVAAVFIGHGAQRLFGLLGGTGLDGTAAEFAALGLSPPAVLAIVFGVVEFAGGAMLVLGAFTSWVASVLALDSIVFAWKVHAFNGFFLNSSLTAGVEHGFEYHLLLVAALVSLAFTGAGDLSVDGWRHRSAEAAAAGLARIRAGKV